MSIMTQPSSRGLAANATSRIFGIGRVSLEKRKIQATCLAEEMRSLGNAFSKDQISACEMMFDIFVSDDDLHQFESTASSQLFPGSPDADWSDLSLSISQVMPANGWPTAPYVMVENSPDWEVPGVVTGMFQTDSGMQRVYASDMAYQFPAGMTIQNVPSPAWWMVAQKAFALISARHAHVAEFEYKFSHNGSDLGRWYGPGCVLFDRLLTEVIPNLPPTEEVVRVYIEYDTIGRHIVVGSFWPFKGDETTHYVDMPVGTRLLLCSSNWQTTCVIFPASLLHDDKFGLNGAVDMHPVEGVLRQWDACHVVDDTVHKSE